MRIEDAIREMHHLLQWKRYGRRRDFGSELVEVAIEVGDAMINSANPLRRSGLSSAIPGCCIIAAGMMLGYSDCDDGKFERETQAYWEKYAKEGD